jgi:hypothetical protein
MFVKGFRAALDGHDSLRYPQIISQAFTPARFGKANETLVDRG